MIFIIGALSQRGKDDGDYDSPTSRDETSDFRKKRERPKKAKEKKEKEKKGKNERIREKGQCYYLFFHTCASK